MSVATDDVRVGETLIRLEHVYKVYRVADTGVAALGGVTFDVARGEVVALVGPSGSGKSSVLNLVGGLDRPTAGAVPAGRRERRPAASGDRSRRRRPAHPGGDAARGGRTGGSRPQPPL